MPMSRYEIRNEYSLADPEIYGGADKDDNDPEALLEAVAMAGLVGVLRQLGDLAQFAAEVFHDLHEEVMVTATRGHGLTVRVKQLEADFPVIEKAILSQTSPLAFFSNQGTGWHPSLQTNQNLITGGDLPRFIMDSYEECRGPPRLFLLDKFDIAGAGACLKRYTDPSFFKVEASSYGLSSAEVLKEKKSRKSKKKGSRLRNAGTPEILPASHAKLQQLFLEDHVENGVTDSARFVKLKRKFNRHPFDSETGKSFMEKFISVSSPEDKVVHEVAYGSSTLELPFQTVSESGIGVSHLKESMSVERTVQTPVADEVNKDLRNRELSLGTKQYPLEVVDEKEIAVDGERTNDNEYDYQSDDVASEVDNFMDALATMEPEVETDTELRSKDDIGFVDMEKQLIDCDANKDLLQDESSESQSTGNSDASDIPHSVKKRSSSFSYSDTGRTAAENMPVDVDFAAKVSPSTKSCEDEVTIMSMEKHSSSEELSPAQDYQPPKLDFPDDTSNDVTNLPRYGSDSEGPCSSVHHSDSFQTHTPLDEGVARGTLKGAQIFKASSNYDELDTKFIKIEENSRSRGNNIPWTSRHCSVHSPTKVDEPLVHTASAENHTLEKLDGDLSVLPTVSSHISENILEVISKEGNDKCSLDDLLEVKHEDIFTDDLIDSEITPLHSVILHADVKSSVAALLDSETSNTLLQPEVLDSVDDVFPSAKSIIVDSNITSDSSYNSSVEEQQEAEWADGVPAIPIVSAFDASNEEETPNSVFTEADSSETGEISSSISLIGSKATSVTTKSDNLYCGGSGSSTGFPVPSDAADDGLVEVSSCMNLDKTEADALAISLDPLNIGSPGSLIDVKQTEAGQLENFIGAAIGANHDSSSDNPVSKRNLQTEDFGCVQDPGRYGSEVYNEIFLQNSDESEKQTTEVNQEISSPNLDSVRSKMDLCDQLDSEMVGHVPELSSQPVKTTAFSSSSIYEVRNTEQVSSVEYKLHEHSGDTVSSSIHHFPDVSTLSEPELTLQTDQFDTELLHVDESNLKKVSQLEQLSCSNNLGEGSSDAHFEPCFVASKSVVPVDSDSLAVESLYGDKASFGSSSKLDVNHADYGGNLITSSKPSLVTPISELSEQGGHEVEISPHAGNELSAVHPGILPLPILPQISLPEMPPLPPLPPAQWRIGRDQQHASLPSNRDSMLVPLMFPSKTSNNTQMDYSTNRDDDFLPPAPMLPPFAVKDEDNQHVYKHLPGTKGHYGPLSMQMPLTSNSRSTDIPTSDKIDVSEQGLTLASTDESPGYHMLVGEAGSMLPSVAPSSTVTGVDSSYMSRSVPNRMHLEVCVETKSTSARSESGLMKFSDTNIPQPTVADERPRDVCTSEGEIARSVSNSLYPAIEDGMLNGNQPMKLQRPRSPLIDAVAAHDKSMLRKVTERSRPEVQKVEERDSLLEQIRAKSFNLKPAVVIRPSIQGPKTNLRVAAILEKANAIRQAFAGSDEDEDSWSDS